MMTIDEQRVISNNKRFTRFFDVVFLHPSRELTHSDNGLLSCPLLIFLVFVWQVKALPIPASGGGRVEPIKLQHKILSSFT
jgi:hypothetical protein